MFNQLLSHVQAGAKLTHKYKLKYYWSAKQVVKKPGFQFDGTMFAGRAIVSMVHRYDRAQGRDDRLHTFLIPVATSALSLIY